MPETKSRDELVSEALSIALHYSMGRASIFKEEPEISLRVDRTIFCTARDIWDNDLEFSFQDVERKLGELHRDAEIGESAEHYEDALMHLLSAYRVEPKIKNPGTRLAQIARELDSKKAPRTREFSPLKPVTVPLTPSQIRAELRDSATKIAPSCTLGELIAVFKKWLYIKDESLIWVTLATFAANLGDGDAVWLMIVGGSSSGKTETVSPLQILRFAKIVGTVTESSFLSGSSKKDTAKNANGGLLREIGIFGILIIKDFTSILSANHDKQKAVLAALREIYDGSWARDIGNDGGRRLEWSGKIGIIGCCTDAIESAHAVNGAMGERFIRYRLEHSDDEQKEMTRFSLRRAGKDRLMRTEMEKAVAGFFAGLDIPDEQPDLSPSDEEKLIAIATFAAHARSVVDRDPKSRDIDLVHESENPMRLAVMLQKMLFGLRTIGVSDVDAWRILQKIALDSIPKLRAHIVRYLNIQRVNKGEYPSPRKQITTAAKSSDTATRRALEDLRAHGILAESTKESKFGDMTVWCFSEAALELIEIGF